MVRGFRAVTDLRIYDWRVQQEARVFGLGSDVCRVLGSRSVDFQS